MSSKIHLLTSKHWSLRCCRHKIIHKSHGVSKWPLKLWINSDAKANKKRIKISREEVCVVWIQSGGTSALRFHSHNVNYTNLSPFYVHTTRDLKSRWDEIACPYGQSTQSLTSLQRRKHSGGSAPKKVYKSTSSSGKCLIYLCILIREPSFKNLEHTHVSSVCVTIFFGPSSPARKDTI